MPPRRKVEVAASDESDRSLHSMFLSAANNLSQFYALSVSNQKLAFEAGQNYAMVKIHEWMVEKMQEGRIVTVQDILGYLQEKLGDWAPDAGLQDQGASGSGQKSASADMAAASASASASASAPQDQESDPEMQMD